MMRSTVTKPNAPCGRHPDRLFRLLYLFVNTVTLPLASPHTTLQRTLATLPKIDLHRHLEGSVRLETLLDVAEQYQIDLPERTLEGLRPLVQVMPDDENDAVHFLKKFTVLRRFFCAPEVIRRVAREAVLDAANDNIRYLELRFTPRALARLMNYNYSEVIDWVCDGVRQAQAECRIGVGLIVAVNRHESVIDARQQLYAALNHQADGVVGFDLCGQEAGYPAEPFFPIFVQARRAGLGITIHAGEWVGPANIRAAIQELGAQRIGHGVRIVEDNKIVQLALSSGTTFEVCPTSNVQSGVVYAIAHHPLLDMNYLGLRTTINTDDPAISAITLSAELAVAVEQLGMTLPAVRQALLRSAEAAFLSDADRQQLIAQIQDELPDAASTPDEH